jgi:pimeloyl-ACP methyl ester carboxylesterase
MLAVTTLVLIHGGLWDDGMDAERLWATPGILAGLQRCGCKVLAANRPARAPSWAAEADQLAPTLSDRPVTLVAGSNGCAVAVRLALARPDRIERLLLAWPPSAGDPVVDARVRGDLAELGVSPQVIDQLLAGQTLRGVADAELATLQMSVGVLPSAPENPVHQRQTVDALLRQVRHAKELPGCPEPPHPEFPAHLERFLTAVTRFAAS